ncbi:hypothetical protein CYLTODRAFT_495024 [Cylindrobasidium torrendii FP15055 ss-10]|uniref:Uncharacterized protein n=1 Tax=Cylindrobasidium torrendii FP15055 ss-10 TaxID=1314674 RepID=A0A0D7AUZ4_9AGAR|nr:hypothetical protein CYLTODRAFT_495024 [Cylindrobasidium torrendii FP15055 ss-10]
MPRLTNIHGEWQITTDVEGDPEVHRTQGWPLVISEAAVAQGTDLVGWHIYLRLFINKVDSKEPGKGVNPIEQDIDCVIACLTPERKTASLNVTIPAFTSFAFGCDGDESDQIVVSARFISYDLM